MSEKGKALAALLFPHIDKTPEDYLAAYPARDLPQGARVTRFAPSPTGFLHIGGLFSALASALTARQTGGVFILRIEDTDKKREIEDGVTGIIEGLRAFGVRPDEGVTGLLTEEGAYGPYTQSKRRDIYQSFVKRLVEEEKAYPCFLTPDELAAIREKQEAEKKLPGCYGVYARYRDIGLQEAEALIKEGKEYVIRLRSPGTEDGKVSFEDGIKGPIQMAENITDVVLLKSDGLPTYHFAHAVDDTLMRVTHVVRGDEWIASVPIHLQLFEAIGQPAPAYAHIAPILKDDQGGRRKISKRKDPEAAVTYFVEEGYPAEAVLEYLLTLLNSDYEDWRRQNPDAERDAFPFSLQKMSASGALFDLLKLADISKTLISRMGGQEVYERILAWAEAFKPDFAALIQRDPAQSTAMLEIDRGGDKPRKDLAKWADAPDYLAYFFDETFPGFCPLPDNLAPADAVAVLRLYQEKYDETLDKDQWFAALKELCPALGFAPEVKLYKKNPGDYKGHVGDVSTVIRIAATGRRQTPDLCSILKILGRDRFFDRVGRFITELEGAL